MPSGILIILFFILLVIYFGVNKGVAGLSIIELVDGSCKDCSNLSYLISEISALVNISNHTVVDITSDTGRQLVDKYNITHVPTLIIPHSTVSISGGLNPLLNFGSVEADDSFILRLLNPVYKDLKNNITKLGLVKILFLTDSSCSECYNASVHELILANRFGVNITDKLFVDISSDAGKILVTGYNITKVPTVILSPDVKDYNLLNLVWDSVGSVEKDGYYIFRNIDSLNGAVYRNLTQ